jgi:hypothetical protein
VCNKLFVGLFPIIYVVNVFLPLVSVEEEAWELGVATARVRVRLGGLGMTRFRPGACMNGGGAPLSTDAASRVRLHQNFSDDTLHMNLRNELFEFPCLFFSNITNSDHDDLYISK